MRFVHQHRLDILDCLGRHLLPESDFDFVKKRGRICIKYRKTGDKFAYLRKKETRLDPVTKQWLNAEWFKVKSGLEKEQEVISWEQVIEMLDRWLFEIIRNK